MREESTMVVVRLTMALVTSGKAKEESTMVVVKWVITVHFTVLFIFFLVHIMKMTNHSHSGAITIVLN